MGMKINTNIPSMNAGQQLGNKILGLNKNFQKLSTGLRINSAADDAAGLAISERYRTLVRQYQQENENLQSGINYAQTAEGGLEAQGEAVQRIRELAVQASNGTLSDEDRAAINQEAQQLIEQIQTTAEDTEFNGMNPLSGDSGAVNLGTTAGNEINVNSSTTTDLGLDGLDLSTQAGAAAAIDAADTAGQRISQNRAGIGAQQNRLDRAINERENRAQNLQEADSMLRDLDFARETIEQTRNEILIRSSMSALVQGNVVPQAAAGLLA